MNVQSRGASRDVFAFLRNRPNQRFTGEQIAGHTGVPRAAVAAILCAAYSSMRAGLHREDTAQGAKPHYAYWMSDAGEFTGCDPVAYKVARWMIRRDVAVRPSQVAEATGTDLAVVAHLLERWAAKGSAVRCELMTRSGHDRFEYRLAASTGFNFGAQRISYKERAVA